MKESVLEPALTDGLVLHGHLPLASQDPVLIQPQDALHTNLGEDGP